MPPKGSSPKDKPETRTLEVRDFPAELLDRVLAAAQLLGMDKKEFLAGLLTRDLAQLEQLQKALKEWWANRVMDKREE